MDSLAHFLDKRIKQVTENNFELRQRIEELETENARLRKSMKFRISIKNFLKW